MHPTPRSVRNFWISARVDGRKHPLLGGPRNRQGGIALDLYQRVEGRAVPALELYCFASRDETLMLEVSLLLPFTLSQPDGKVWIRSRR